MSYQYNLKDKTHNQKIKVFKIELKKIHNKLAKNIKYINYLYIEKK